MSEAYSRAAGMASTPDKSDRQKNADAFHEHADVCQECRKAPYLCTVGEALFMGVIAQ